MSNRIELTHADKHTGTWDKLQRYWEQELNDLRKKNDFDLDPVATAKLRGRIEQVKGFLSMDKEMPKIEQHNFDAA